MLLGEPLVSGKLKERFNHSIEREAELLVRAGFTPHAITAMGFVLSLFSSGLYMVTWNRQLTVPVAGIVLLLSGFFDALDGAVARLSGKATTFGGFLDSVVDRYSDAVVLIAIVLGGLCETIWGLLALVGSLLVSYARARAEAADVKMMSKGLAERPERMILIALMSLASYVWLPILGWGIILLALVSHFTVLQRVYYFRKAVIDQ